MAPSNIEKINSSLGEVGKPEDRTFGRKYLTVNRALNTGFELVDEFARFLPETLNSRRFVMRSLLSDDAVNYAKHIGLPIEAGIPMSLVTGNEQEKSTIVYIAKNRHDSPRQGENPREFIKNRSNGRIPVDRARNLPNEYLPTRNLTDNDAAELYNLWERFGWEPNEIKSFIKRVQNKENNLWFSGIRDIKTGKLIAVCNAEAIEFAGIRYIETTEYSTNIDYEGQHLSTTAVSALIAQILKDVYYENNDDLIPVITAEFNTSSTSPSVGASAGFIIPDIDGIDGILSYNVAVRDNGAPNKVFNDSKKSDRGIPYSQLRDFALAVLPINKIQELYPPEVVGEIINYYQ